MNCGGCPFYLFREYRAEKFCRDHRSNYCGHPAFFESYGIEQFNGTTNIGETNVDNHCILERDCDEVQLLRDAWRNPAIYATCELSGPALNPMSILNR